MPAESLFLVCHVSNEERYHHMGPVVRYEYSDYVGNVEKLEQFGIRGQDLRMRISELV